MVRMAPRFLVRLLAAAGALMLAIAAHGPVAPEAQTRPVAPLLADWLSDLPRAAASPRVCVDCPAWLPRLGD